MYTNKTILSVADAVMKVMEAEQKAKTVAEELKGNQHKIDANKNGKIDAHDFKLLRGKKTMKKEEQEVELKEAGMPSSVIKHKQNLANMTDQEFAKRHADTSHADLRSMAHRHFGTKAAGPGTRGNEIYVNRVKKGSVQNEEVELDEAFPTVADGEKSLRAKEGKTSKGMVAKTKTGLVHTRDYEDDKEEDSATPGKRGRPVKDKFAKKKLGEMRQQFLNYMEEVDNETFTKELKDQEAKMNGKKKGADVAKPAVQAVKQEEVEQMDEVAPPGREDQVKALKKVPGIDNPYAVSWASYKKSHSKKTKE